MKEKFITLNLLLQSNTKKNILIFFFLILPFFSVVSETIELKKLNEEKKYLLKINTKEFYELVAKVESSDQYNVSNKYLMLGKYQASYGTLREFGYSHEKIMEIRKSVYQKKNSKGLILYYFDEKLFLPEEQEVFIQWYFNKIETIYMKKYIEEYVGKTIDSVYITKAGILYASSLGFNHVRKFLKSNGETNFSDSFGTSIKKRLQKMQNVELK